MPGRWRRRHQEAIRLAGRRHKESIKTVDSAAPACQMHGMNETPRAAAAGPGAYWRAAPPPPAVAAAVLLVAAVVLAGHALRDALPIAGLSLAFLVVVLVSAVRFGFWTGMITAGLAFLAYNFFFVEPILTLRVARAEDVVELAVFLIVAALTGVLAGRMREEADAARRRAAMLERLADFSADVGNAGDAQAIAAAMARHLGRIAGTGAIVLEPRGGGLALAAASPEAATPDVETMQAAERALRRGSPEKAAAPGWTGSRYAFHPVRAHGAVVAVVGIAGAPVDDTERAHAIEAVLRQGEVAIEGALARRDAAEAHAAADRERLRAALLSSLSHDLRTPLAAILGSVTSLRQFGDALPAEARADLLGAIEEEAGRLSRYVANLLNMTRLQAGLEPSLDWIDPADVAHGAVERARRSFPARAIALAAEAALPLIRSDAALLDQVLFNLIENAVKFAPPPAPVRVAVVRAGQGLRFSVSDDGPGIAAADRDRLFEPFFRGSAPQAPGTGLGLAICRGIVQALGGTIAAVSPLGEGRGTEMRVDLPVERPAERPPPA